MPTPPTVLGVDLGLRTGVALFGEVAPGRVRLRRYGSTHVGSRATLRRAAGAMLDEAGEVGLVVVEGDRAMARIWERAAAHRGAGVTSVAPETWRQRLLVARDRHPAAVAKRAAGRLAVAVIGWSREGTVDGPAAPTGPLRHDTADAIMVGLWGVLDLGLVAPAELPFPLPTAWPAGPRRDVGVMCICGRCARDGPLPGR